MLIYILINLFFFNACQLEKKNDRLVHHTDTTIMEKTTIELKLVHEIEDASGSEIIWNEENGDWVLCGGGQLMWGNGRKLVSKVGFPNYYNGSGDFNLTNGGYFTFDRKVFIENDEIIVQALDRALMDPVSEEEMAMNYFFENAYASDFIRNSKDGISLVSYEHRAPAGFDEDPYQGKDNLLILEINEPIQRKVLDEYAETMEITGLGMSEAYYFAANQNLHIWDKSLQKINHNLSPNYSSKVIDIISNDGHVLLFRANGTLEIISIENWELVNTMQILDDRPNTLAYDRKNSLLVAGAQNQELSFYKWKGSSFELKEKKSFDSPVLTAKLEPSGQFLYVSHPERLSIYRILISE